MRKSAVNAIACVVVFVWIVYLSLMYDLINFKLLYTTLPVQLHSPWLKSRLNSSKENVSTILMTRFTSTSTDTSYLNATLAFNSTLLDLLWQNTNANSNASLATKFTAITTDTPAAHKTFSIKSTLSNFIFINVSENAESTASVTTHLPTSTERVPNAYEMKRIYAFQPIWGYDWPSGRLGFVKSCPINNCLLSSGGKLPEYEIDAFIFLIPTWGYYSKEVEKIKRKPHHMFIFYSTEPPELYGMPTNLSRFDGFFNRTMSYLSGSDFWQPYGRIDRLSTAPKTNDQRRDLIDSFLKSDYNPALKKTKLAIWMVSTCNTPSNREKYVQYLQKYMLVDIISKDGRCGGNESCPKDKREACYEMIENDYKFYLAFENSICNEYVTEKFFQYMARNIVPVVLGGANYSAFAPEHSYINALDYTPKQLAEYLVLLDRNDTLYKEYFWWKNHYQVINTGKFSEKVFCEICAELHGGCLENKSVPGLHDWYYSQSNCTVKPLFSAD